ncbi:hypothetical protein G6F37_000644 [Rhizopus arrhizus]|nr:hypothetical protein G6F38_000099 [Rhizopus arrhizus]KAG1164043.1 hypothetical protein G6F37_000644 [Rhizopus arrhizus]
MSLPSFSYNEYADASKAVISSSMQQDILSEPVTPLPEEKSLSSTEESTVSPNLIRRGHQIIPSRPESFTTTTFHSNPSGPVRRRRTETFFSFDMGPTFSETKQFYEICNLEQTNNYKIEVNAKLDRGFFKAEQNWTCYRRNYFQVSATFNVQGTHYPLQGSEIPCLLRKGNEMVRVDYFSIGIFARVANYDKKIELVQHTPKRDKGPQMIPQPRPVRAGGNLHLASIGSNQNIATFERLQFKTATANNGKRRAAQQYYEIVVDLYANTNQEEPIRVASCSSAQLVVRGRSPGHYADSHTRFKSSAEHFSSPPYSLPNSPPHDVYSPPYPLGHFPPPPPPPTQSMVYPSSSIYFPSSSSSSTVYFSNSSETHSSQVYDTTYTKEKNDPVKQTYWPHQDNLYQPYERQENYSIQS